MPTNLGSGSVVRVTAQATLFRLDSGAHRWIPNAAVHASSIKSHGQSGAIVVADDLADGTGAYVVSDRDFADFDQGRATFSFNSSSGKWTLQADWNAALSANGKTQVDALAKFIAHPLFSKP